MMINKKQLYESIIKRISKQIKQILNEEQRKSLYDESGEISDDELLDLYNSPWLYNIKIPLLGILEYFHDRYLHDVTTIIPERDNEVELTINNKYVTITSIDYENNKYKFNYIDEYNHEGTVTYYYDFNDDREIIQMFISYIVDNSVETSTHLNKIVDKIYEIFYY